MNGLIIQWERSALYWDRDVKLPFTFPITFSEIPLCVSSAQPVNGSILAAHSILALSKTGCTVHSYGWDSSTAAGYLGYVAIGY